MGDWSDDEGAAPLVKKPAQSGGGDDWGDDDKPSNVRDSGSSRGGRGGGRGASNGDWGNDASNDGGDGGFSRGGGFRGRGGRGGGGRGGSNNDGGSRDGDWTCSSCNNSNFASRTTCRQCNQAKDGSGDGGAAKEPNWICSGCQNSNFASRRQCRNCNQAKDGSSDGAKEPDWICSGCQNSNFASRRQCRNCSAVKEGAEGEADGEKKRELYIPPEPTDNEEEMFGQGISAGINFSKFDKIEVKVSSKDGISIPPCDDFKQSGLRDFLIENVKRSGYVKPTPIQKHAIPIIMAGRDLMGCAQTGSGKTAAFILPILHAIMSDTESSVGQPQCLIVAPTRELVIQIFDEARKFANRSYVKIAIAYGGTASRHQSQALSKGCHVLVATPGRLMDFVDKALVTFESLRFLVLDEADRMLDMGFKDKIHQIANHPTLDKDKLQTMMFSATFPAEIQSLAASYLRDYMFLVVGIVGGASTDVEQQVIEVTKFKKRSTLGEILKEYINNSEEDRILVFVETKKTADFIASFMSETKISSTSIHGDREQREREEALRDFRNGTRKVLVATSVAARGLDIKGVTHVINYDLPKDVQDYVHRIGRTGRVGNRGKATSFYDPEFDANIASELARILKEAGQPVPEFLGEAGEGEAASAFGGTDVRSGVKAATKQNDEDDW